MERKRAFVLQGEEESIRKLDDLIREEGIRVYDSTWGNPRDFLKVIIYRRDSPDSATDRGF